MSNRSKELVSSQPGDILAWQTAENRLEEQEVVTMVLNRSTKLQIPRYSFLNISCHIQERIEMARH